MPGGMPVSSVTRERFLSDRLLELADKVCDGTTLPLLLVETCGIGLLERQRLRAATGLPLPEDGEVVLLFSRPRLTLQVLVVQS